MNSTIEINSIKFLDTHLYLDGIYVTKGYRKETKVPGHQSSHILQKYKRNIVIADLHCAKRDFHNFKEKIEFIRSKFLKADFPLPFINSLIKDFINQQETVQQNNKEEFIIPYCKKNEVESKDFIKKFHKITNNQLQLAISWNTTN